MTECFTSFASAFLVSLGLTLALRAITSRR